MVGGTPLDEWSASRRDLWQHTTLTTDIHATGGIQTRNPSKRAAQTHVLGRAAPGIGYDFYNSANIIRVMRSRRARGVGRSAASQSVIQVASDWLTVVYNQQAIFRCYVHTYIRTYVCMYVYTSMYVCMYVRKCICMYVVWMCVYVYVCMYVRVYVRMYVCRCVCIYVCTYMYVCMYICVMYVCVCVISLEMSEQFNSLTTLPFRRNLLPWSSRYKLE